MTQTTDRGPADFFEVVWKNGRRAFFLAHQTSHPLSGDRLQFHSEVAGRWGLVLSVKESDIEEVINHSRAMVG